MKKEIIIGTVQKLRDELSLTELPVNLNKFFEHFDNLDIIYDVERDHLLDGNIRKDITNNHYFISLSCKKEDMTQSDRFKLARQLGHLFLGHVDRQNIAYRRGTNKLDYEANEFAAELLMPKSEFYYHVNKNIDENNRCDVESVAKIFDVEPQVVITRGKFLGLFEW